MSIATTADRTSEAARISSNSARSGRAHRTPWTTHVSLGPNRSRSQRTPGRGRRRESRSMTRSTGRRVRPSRSSPSKNVAERGAGRPTPSPPLTDPGASTPRGHVARVTRSRPPARTAPGPSYAIAVRAPGWASVRSGRTGPPGRERPGHGARQGSCGDHGCALRMDRSLAAAQACGQPAVHRLREGASARGVRRPRPAGWRRRRRFVAMRVSCRSRRGLPSSSRWWRAHSPDGSSHHDACRRRRRGRAAGRPRRSGPGRAGRTRHSTRRSRLRCIRSADPIHADGAPPFSNQKIRLCSRNRPRTDRTRMFSDSPGTPGRTAQMPRVSRSTGTPACEAR